MTKNGTKLTKAQRAALEILASGSDIIANGDEYTPQWWFEGGSSIKWNTAVSLRYHKLIEYYRHLGGQPGVDFYRITDAGLQALSGATDEQ